MGRDYLLQMQLLGDDAKFTLPGQYGWADQAMNGHHATLDRSSQKVRDDKLKLRNPAAGSETARLCESADRFLISGWICIIL